MKINSIEERQVGYCIRSLLNEASEVLPAHVADRLVAARRAAMLRKKKESLRTPLAWVGNTFILGERFGAGRRLQALCIAVLLSIGLSGAFYWQQQLRHDEFAAFDIAMLTDDLPPTAYLDHGFEVFLSRGE